MSDSVRVNLDIPREAAVVLDRIADERGLTRTALIRQAIGIFQAMHDGAKEGRYTGLTKRRENLETLLIAPL